LCLIFFFFYPKETWMDPKQTLRTLCAHACDRKRTIKRNRVKRSSQKTQGKGSTQKVTQIMNYQKKL